MQDLTQAQWEENIKSDDNAQILDVRTDEEVGEGYIPGMKQIDIRDAAGFMEEVKTLDKSKNYYVYCRSGGRSAQACMIMDSLGFENTNNLLGGFMEWNGETTK